MSEQQVDSAVHAFVRDTSSSFRLPADPTIPVVMVAAGTGLAPFRGFLQERAAEREAGRRLEPAVLVQGCRHPQADELYGDELGALAAAADVELAAAYSRVPGLPRVYVQDRVRQLGERVMTMLDQGGRAYVCGSAAMADGVRTTLVEMRQELRGQNVDDAEQWLKELAGAGRLLVDVWASS